MILPLSFKYLINAWELPQSNERTLTYLILRLIPLRKQGQRTSLLLPISINIRKISKKAIPIPNMWLLLSQTRIGSRNAETEN